MPTKREFIASMLQGCGLNWLLRGVNPWRGLLVLNYHRIGDARASLLDHGVFSATAEHFAWQLGWLKAHADVVAMADLPRVLHTRRGRHVLITFDDGYRDNHQTAFPLLRDARLPATFFVTSGFLDGGGPSWWDDMTWMIRHARQHRLAQGPWTKRELTWRAGTEGQAIRELLDVYKSLPTEQTQGFLDWIADATGAGRCPTSPETAPWMSWDMLREMHRAGFGVGCHTETHPLLGRSTRERQQREIEHSKTRIEQELGAPIEVFSYPVGLPGTLTDETVELVRAAGFRYAFAFQGGATSYSRAVDEWRLPRIAMEHSCSRSWLRTLHALPQVWA